MAFAFESYIRNFINDLGLTPFGQPAGDDQVINFSDAEVPAGPIDDTNLIFTLAHTPVPGLSVELVVNGSVLRQGIDFAVSINQLTLNNPAGSGAIMQAWYRF